jgi:predicted RNA-binding Zn-ribbon protein involved in translation (DUF1610 family)
MARYIHDADDRVYACPSCDAAGDVYRRTHATREYDHEFKCHKCGAEFDDAVERDRKPTPVGTGYAPRPEDDDGLPQNLNAAAKAAIRAEREST